MGAITRGHANLITTAGKLLSTGVVGGVGKIGQVVQATSTTVTNIASTSLADTNLSASITPTATSSKVLVMISQVSAVDRDNEDGWLKYKLVRDSTDIHEWSNIWWIESGGVGAIKNGGFTSLMYVDSPSSTSSVTYKTQGAISNTSNNGTARFQQNSKESYIQLLEVLA
tara:strand:+ start:222 stop:731 length:510 start_codon:yes stop_codon:yes gene_type:complete